MYFVVDSGISSFGTSRSFLPYLHCTWQILNYGVYLLAEHDLPLNVPFGESSGEVTAAPSTYLVGIK